MENDGAPIGNPLSSNQNETVPSSPFEDETVPSSPFEDETVQPSFEDETIRSSSIDVQPFEEEDTGSGAAARLDAGKALYTGDIDNAILFWCRNACKSTWMNATVLFAILFNTVLLAVENPANILAEDTLLMMVAADSVLTIGFTVEMFIRIIAMGFWDRNELADERLPKYLNDDWNKLDFFVVLSSWLNVLVDVTGIELGVEMKTLRALRIMRVLKAFKNIDGIRQILGTIGAALPYSLNVMAFLGFLFVVMGIIGIQMFRGLGLKRCEYATFDLQALLNPDKFPLLDGSLSVNGSLIGSTAPWDGNTTYSDSASHPWPQPPLDLEPSDAGYEYPIGIGMWINYCTVDADCPLYDIPGPYNRTQTCQPSLNPGKGFQNYDNIGDAWIALFINMANLYWWETAHRLADANNGLGSTISWTFGMFNVFFLSYITVNMFVAVITTVFMDVRSSNAPDEGLGGGEEQAMGAIEKRENAKQIRDERGARWSKPFYFVAAFGGRGPFEEHEALYSEDAGPERRDPSTREGVINQKWFDNFILSFILLNTILLALDHHNRSACRSMQVDDPCQSDDFIATNKVLNYIFNFVFTMECILKVMGMGFREYIRVHFNKLDFFIVVTSGLDMLGEAMADGDEGGGFAIFKLFRMFRLFRVLRVMRILYKNKNLKRVLVTVLGSGASLANLILFIFFSVLIFAIGGMHLLGGGYHPENADWGYGDNSASMWGRLSGDGVYDIRYFALSSDVPDAHAEYRYGYDVQEFIRLGLIPRRNFEDFPRAFLLAFQVMTGDDWVNQMHDHMEMSPGWITPLLFFINFAFCNFILLSLFIAVILENFEIAEKEKMELQKEKMQDENFKKEEQAKKAKISFVHRLVWLCGGDGKKPGTVCSIEENVALDRAGVYSDLAEDRDLIGSIATVDNPLTKDERVIPALKRLIANWDCQFQCQKNVFRNALEGTEPGTSDFEGAIGTFLDGLDRKHLVAFARQLAQVPVDFGTILPGTKWYNDDKSLFLFEPKQSFRNRMATLANDGIFDKIVLVAILLGTVLLAIEGPPDSLPDETQRIFDRINDVLFLIFLVEFASKTIGYGFLFPPKSYLKDPWNKLDFVVIVGSVINYMGGDAGFVRLLRCLRPLRIINRNEGMRVIISAVVNSLAVNLGVLALSGLGLLMFAILGVALFAGGMYSCNCSFTYPEGLSPTNTRFLADGGWINIATGELCTENNSTSPFFNPDSAAGRCRPQVVVKEQQCIGEHGDSVMYGIDPSFPSAVSQCFWDNRPYNFDTTGNAMMALFTASTLAGWTDIMEIGMDSTGIGMQPIPFSGVWAAKSFYFLMYIMIMAFFITNLFIGVLIDFIGNSDGSALLTEAQQQLLDLSKFQKLHRPALRDQVPDNAIRKWFYNLVESAFWDKLSNGFIVFNVVIMMCEYEGQTQSWLDMQDLCNAICLYFFTIEMFLKLIGYFPVKYLSDPWSKFDVVVIGLSWAAVIFEVSGAQAIRAMRALRIVLVLKSAKGIRSLFQTLIMSIPPAINISVLVLLLYALYAILGMMLFGNMPIQDIECAMKPTDMSNKHCAWPIEDSSAKFAGIAGGEAGQMLMGLNRQYTHHSSFRNFKDAMGLLFQCAAGQDWKFVMYAVGGEPCGYDCKDPDNASYTLAFVYFGSFFFFSNYILLNLFVAVILDNFAASMREQELNISEADFEEFKYAFRAQTSDKTPELLPYQRLWTVLATIGKLDGHTDDGFVIENALAPPPICDWSRDEFIAWKIAKGRGADEECGDVQSFVRNLYFQNNSPINNERERVGIGFTEHWNALLETPSMFEFLPKEAMPAESLRSDSVKELDFTWKNVTEWEAFRLTSGKTSISYTSILYGLTSLRARMRLHNLRVELDFHGHSYIDEDSKVKYDDFLQALVNLNCGEDALSLEDQMARKARNKGREDASLAAMQVNLSEALTETMGKIEAAEMNANVTEKAMAKLKAERLRYEDALEEYDLTDEQMDIVHQGASANKQYAAEQQEKQWDVEGDSGATVVVTKKRTRAAILGGLKSGALETAVAKMEADIAAEEAQTEAPAEPLRIEEGNASS